MIFKTLGLGDLIAVILLLGAAIFPKQLLLYAGVYLAIKGLFFILLSNDFASYGDGASGIYMVLMAIGISMPFLTTAALIYLAQKTFLTFVKIGIETYSLYRLIKETGLKKTESPYYYLR